MTQEQVKLNKLGKPIQRDKGYRFAKGNKEGKLFGTDHESKGRPKGSINLMTIIKQVALEKSSNDGKTNMEFIVCSMVESARELKRIIDNMDDSDPRRAGHVARLGDLSAKIMEHLTKYSGDYTQRISAQLSETLSDEEKAVMERMMNKDKK